MKPPGFIEPTYKPVSDLKGGLNVGVPPDHIADDEFQDISNLVYVNGVLQVDTGFYTFGYRVAGNPMLPVQVELSTGVLISCLITTVAFYTWDAAISDWVLAMTPYLTTTSGLISGTPWSPVFNSSYGPVITSGGSGGVGSTTGISIGDVVSIACTNGRFFTSTVAAVNTMTSVVTYTDGLLPGYVIAAGATTKFYKPYHGGAYSISWTIDPTTNTLIWTNGVDPVQAFASGTNAPLAGLYNSTTPSSSIATTARLVTRYHGYTLAIGTTESGSYLPYRVRRSTPVSSTDWTSYAAGFDDLTDTNDAIVGVTQIGGYLVLFRENSIMTAQYWGVSYATFYYQYNLLSTGQLGNGGSGLTQNAGVVVSQSGIYAYIGDFNVTPIGEKVYNYILGPFGNLDPTNGPNLFLFYVQQLNEMWFCYPSTGNTYGNILARFSIKYHNWHIRKFDYNPALGKNTQIAGIGIFYRTAALEWEQIPSSVSWVDNPTGTPPTTGYIGAWNQRAAAGNFPTLLLAAFYDRVTYCYDYLTQKDSNYDPVGGVDTPQVISWYLISKDYPVLTEKLIFDGISLYGRGTCEVDISPDAGVTWQTVGIINFGSQLARQSLDYQMTSNFFRLRVSGTDPTFQLADMAPRYLDASEY